MNKAPDVLFEWSNAAQSRYSRVSPEQSSLSHLSCLTELVLADKGPQVF